MLHIHEDLRFLSKNFKQIYRFIYFNEIYDFFIIFYLFVLPCREEVSRRRIRTLKRQIEEVKREKETELQSRNEMIAHLKDQLQVCLQIYFKMHFKQFIDMLFK